MGAANRELARLGIGWHYGPADRTGATVKGARRDGVRVTERYRLVREGTSPSDTLATAGGAPWIVAGAGYVLVGSRLDPSSTDLPVRAAFIPWLADVLSLRLGAPGDGGAPLVVSPGAPFVLPPGVETLESASGVRRSVDDARALAPAERGVWFMLRRGRRVGALVVDSPAEESVLARWSAQALASRLAAGDGRATTSPDRWIRDTYAAGTRRPAATPLLVIALLLIAAEAAAVRSSRSSTVA